MKKKQDGLNLIEQIKTPVSGTLDIYDDNHSNDIVLDYTYGTMDIGTIRLNEEMQRGLKKFLNTLHHI